jgi:hypothetical protein
MIVQIVEQLRGPVEVIEQAAGEVELAVKRTDRVNRATSKYALSPDQARVCDRDAEQENEVRRVRRAAHLGVEALEHIVVRVRVAHALKGPFRAAVESEEDEPLAERRADAPRAPLDVRPFGSPEHVGRVLMLLPIWRDLLLEERVVLPRDAA